MKKVLKIQNLKCANCAQKIEKAAAQLSGVKEVKVDFASSQIDLDIDQEKYDEIINTLKAIIERIDRNAALMEN